jgi:hypothetical protein
MLVFWTPITIALALLLLAVLVALAHLALPPRPGDADYLEG